MTEASMQITPSQDDGEDDKSQALLGEEGTIYKCFSVIQTKKFWSPLRAPTCRLCPSMDLVILGVQAPATSSPSSSSSSSPQSSDSAAASSLWIHRTLSWQRLSTLTNNFDGKEDTAEGDQGVTHVAWSPDGRNFALALPNGQVALYHVEAMVSSSSLSSMSGSDGNAQGLLCVMPSVAQEGIVGLTWAHVGRNHPRWNLSDAEVEKNISWSYRSRYLDRAAELLPPSDHYNLLQSQDHQGNHSSTALPTCKTPLSLLCVSTKGKGMHLYLHGRYRLLTLPMMAQRNVNVVCSSDLKHLLVHQERSMNLSLFTIPFLSKHRYHLQTISSLYCSISSHLEAMKEHATEILASWKVSIKPLDTKMDGLVRLLRDYGVKLDIRSVLVQYILVGHTSVSSEMSNAIDQFFTGVQLNDQLITRMERSLQGAIANVETTARSFLLGPARALAFHAGELLGLARSASDLLCEDAAQKAHDSCAVLLTTVEYTLVQLVEARFRLRDFVAWLRCAGSEIKARGTAANSAQRENAKKRRVPQATVERILKYLQKETYKSSSVTETILGIPLTELLNDGLKFVHSARPSSPTTVANKEFVSGSMERITPTVLHATKVAEKCVGQVFEAPRTFLSRSVYRTDLFLPVERKTEFLPVAIHTRLGKDGPTEDDEYADDETEEEGFFSPKVAEGKSLPELPHYDSRHWSVIAKTSSPTEDQEKYSVKLYLIPQGWTDPNDEIEDEDALGYGISEDDQAQECGVPFYLTTEIILPEGRRVLDMAFYGDDGRSNLSSGLDSGTGRERRQALGILLGNGSSGSSGETIELWLLKYDNLTFHVIPAKKDSKQVFLDDSIIDSQCRAQAQPLRGPEEDCEEEEGVVFAKTREVGLFETSTAHNDTSRLMLCGSRGVGGVVTTSQGVTTLDLFDLEEDEEPDEEEEDNQSMETDV